MVKNKKTTEVTKKQGRPKGTKNHKKPKYTKQEIELGRHRIWNVSEKKNLLKSLRVCQVEDFAEIRKFVPTRTEDEIKWYLDSIKNRANKSINRSCLKAPISVWLQLTENLVQKKLDHSYELAKVMSIAGNLEPHKLPQSSSDPNYEAIYGYLAAVLRGESTPNLSKLDSAIILDLLQHLAEELKEMDCEAQRELMKRKYELLHMKVDIDDKETSYSYERKAFNDDEILKDEQEKADSPDTPAPGMQMCHTGENTGNVTIATTTNQQHSELNQKTSGASETTQSQGTPGASETTRNQVIPGASETTRSRGTPGASETTRSRGTPGASETTRSQGTPGASETTRSQGIPGASSEESRSCIDFPANVQPDSGDRITRLLHFTVSNTSLLDTRGENVNTGPVKKGRGRPRKKMPACKGRGKFKLTDSDDTTPPVGKILGRPLFSLNPFNIAPNYLRPPKKKTYLSQEELNG